MARKKTAKSSKLRSAGMVGALAAGLAGGGYYVGKNVGGNGFPLPEKLAALLPAGKAAPKAAQAPDAKTADKPTDSPIVKLVDKAELSRLLKGAEAKLIGAVRPESERRGKNAAKAEARKADASKTETAKAEAKAEVAKIEVVKTELAKAEAAKPDGKAAAKTQSSKSHVGKAQAQASDNEAPLPPARIPVVAKADAAPASIAEAIAAPEEKPAQSVARPAAGPATSGGAPLGVALTGKGIPTSEDSKIRLSVGFSNRTGKPIRAFEGVLKFTDQNDRSLFSSTISVSALIAEGGSLQWDERVDPDKLGKKLVDAEKENVKAVFVAKKVFFVDGSVQKFGAKG